MVVGLILLFSSTDLFSQDMMLNIGNHPDDIYWSDIFYPRTFDRGAACFTEHEGNLIAGGYFEFFPSGLGNGIAQWNGVSWQPIGTGVEVIGDCSALAVFHDTLFAAGDFNFTDDSTDFILIYWDGNSWLPLDIEIDGDIEAMVVYNDMLVAGGSISRVNGIDINNLFGWDGMDIVDLNYNYELMQPEDRVDALIVFEDTMLVAGGYRFNPDTYMYQAQVLGYNGIEWNILGQNINGLYESSQIYDMTIYDSMLVVCGQFYNFEGTGAIHIAAWDKTNWLPLCDTVGEGIIQTVGVNNNILYAGGSFITIDDSTVNGIAGWDGTNWNSCNGGLPLADGIYPDGEIEAMYSYAGDLIVSGYFHAIGGIEAAYFARWAGSDWANYETSSGEGLIGSVDEFAIYNETLVALGTMSKAGESSVDSLAAWNGQSWSGFDFSSSMNYDKEIMGAIIEYNDMLVVGGRFNDDSSHYNSCKAMAFDGIEWFAIDTTGSDNGKINDLAIYNNKLYAGGWFDSVGNIESNNLAAWDGADWYAIDGLTESVDLLTVYKNRLIVAGNNMTQAGGVPVNRIAAWNEMEWIGLGDGINGYIKALAIYDDKLHIAVTEIDSVYDEFYYIAVWDGSNWSQLTNYYPFPGEIRSLGVYNNMLFVGADNPGDDYFNPLCLAAWNATDSSWYYMGSGITQANGVDALIGYENTLYVGGSFNLAGGKVSANIARWNGQINICGNTNGDTSLNIMDAVFIINYLYRSGPRPIPIESADGNGNGSINIMDAVYLINYLYKGGPEPLCP